MKKNLQSKIMKYFILGICLVLVGMMGLEFFGIKPGNKSGKPDRSAKEKEKREQERKEKERRDKEANKMLMGKSLPKNYNTIKNLLLIYRDKIQSGELVPESEIEAKYVSKYELKNKILPKYIKRKNGYVYIPEATINKMITQNELKERYITRKELGEKYLLISYVEENFLPKSLVEKKYVLKGKEIKGLSIPKGYISERDLKKNYLSKEVVLKDYVKRGSTPKGYIPKNVLKLYIKKSDIYSNWLPKKTVKENYVSKKTVAEKFVPRSVLTKYIPKSIVQSEYIKKDILDKDHIPKSLLDKDYISKAKLQRLYTKNDIIAKKYISKDKLKKRYISKKRIKRRYLTKKYVKANYKTNYEVSNNYFSAHHVKTHFIDRKTLKTEYIHKNEIKSFYVRKDEIQKTLKKDLLSRDKSINLLRNKIVELEAKYLKQVKTLNKELERNIRLLRSQKRSKRKLKKSIKKLKDYVKDQTDKGNIFKKEFLSNDYLISFKEMDTDKGFYERINTDIDIKIYNDLSFEIHGNPYTYRDISAHPETGSGYIDLGQKGKFYLPIWIRLVNFPDMITIKGQRYEICNSTCPNGKIYRDIYSNKLLHIYYDMSGKKWAVFEKGGINIEKSKIFNSILSKTDAKVICEYKEIEIIYWQAKKKK